MKLLDANRILIIVSGRPYWWLKDYGLSTIREAINIIRNRKGSTKSDRERAEQVNWEIIKGSY